MLIFQGVYIYIYIYIYIQAQYFQVIAKPASVWWVVQVQLVEEWMLPLSPLRAVNRISHHRWLVAPPWLVGCSHPTRLRMHLQMSPLGLRLHKITHPIESVNTGTTHILIWCRIQNQHRKQWNYPSIPVISVHHLGPQGGTSKPYGQVEQIWWCNEQLQNCVDVLWPGALEPPPRQNSMYYNEKRCD